MVGPEKELIQEFERVTGYVFADPCLLRSALTHRSFLNGNDPGQELPDSNERLEFLGDSVLELVVNDYLYRIYPDQQEGELTKMKSLLVSRGVLAEQARRLNLGRYLFLSDAERDSGGAFRASILADGFEAVIGALYLDGGLEEARRFVEQHLLLDVHGILGSRTHVNYKSVLQENIQERHKTYPRYRVVSETGPDHRKIFTVEVTVRGSQLGLGKGTNKKLAEQAAARHALERVGLL
jgi:ribonuclease-3